MINRDDPVEKIMSAALVTVDPDQDVLHAIRTMLDRTLQAVPVVDHRGNVVGVLADRDCMKVVFRSSYHQEWGGPVREFMDAEAKSIEAGTPLVEIPEFVMKHPHALYPVVKNNRVIGQVTRRDIMKTLLEFEAQRPA